MSKKQQQLIVILEVIRIEQHLRSYLGMPGRPRRDRIAMARAFVAKAVYNMPFTSTLVDRLKSDKALRRICGWEYQYQVPDESTFSRAYAEFSERIAKLRGILRHITTRNKWLCCFTLHWRDSSRNLCFWPDFRF